jgi:hypothetical protein
MKSKKHFFPRSLSVLPNLDHFDPGIDPADGGGGAGSNPFDTVDFQLISKSPAHPGEIYDYTEMHVKSPGGGGTIPIKHEDDPQRAIFVTGLPPVGANWEMSVVFTKVAFSDTVKFKRIAGNFATLHQDFLDRIIFEEAEVFFTIPAGANGFETYVNINIANEVAKLSHAQQDTFGLFLVSILGRSN